MLHNTQLPKWRTIERFTLDQVKVVGLLENTILETPAQAFQVSVVDVKFLKSHFASRNKKQSTILRENYVAQNLRDDYKSGRPL